MNDRAVYSLMLAAACCACDRLAPERSVYRPQEAGTVDQALCLLGFTGSPLRTAVTGPHLVDVELNGVSGVFVLDTGANISVVDQRSAATFSLTPSRLVSGQAFGIGGGQNAAIAQIDTMSIAGVPVRNRRIAIANISQVSDVLTPLTGETITALSART